jgi:hypothetical protein
VTHQPHPSNVLDKHPDQVWWQPCHVKHVTSSVLKRFFSIFGHCDLIFDRRRPIFKLDLEIIKKPFLTNFQVIWNKTAATRVLKRFFYF